jgi:hypothetical protein
VPVHADACSDGDCHGNAISKRYGYPNTDTHPNADAHPNAD